MNDEVTVIPDRIPATANDLATSVARAFGQHMEIGMRLSFDGHLDADVLRRAVRLSLDAEPILGCGLRTSALTGWWQRRDDLDAVVPFSIVPVADADTVAARYQVAAVPDEGPQVVVTLLRSPDRDDLAVSVSHLVADGQSVKQYAHLLAGIYSSLRDDPDYVPEPDLAPRPQALDVWRAFTPQERRMAGREPRPTMPNWAIPSKGHTGECRTLLELRLPPGRLAAVKERGRAHGATVNDVLVTAFFRALLRAYPQPPGKPLSLSFAAEHRRYLRGDVRVPVSNLAVTVWMGVEPRPDETFEETLARIAGQSARWRDAKWGVRGAVTASRLAAVGYGPIRWMTGAIAKAGSGSGKTSPVLTNIGLIDPDRLSFGVATPVDARMSGPCAFGASFVPTISTYRDTLTVSMGFCEADTDPAAVEGVLASMDGELAPRA